MATFMRSPVLDRWFGSHRYGIRLASTRWCTTLVLLARWIAYGSGTVTPLVSRTANSLHAVAVGYFSVSVAPAPPAPPWIIRTVMLRCILNYSRGAEITFWGINLSQQQNYWQKDYKFLVQLNYTFFQMRVMTKSCSCLSVDRKHETWSVQFLISLIWTKPAESRELLYM